MPKNSYKQFYKKESILMLLLMRVKYMLNMGSCFKEINVLKINVLKLSCGNFLLKKQQHTFTKIS